MAYRPDNSSVGIVGLGSMGLGMARNMIAADLTVRGYDISPAAREAFAQASGHAVESAAEAATDVGLLVLMVVNAQQARDVLFGEGGAALVMRPGATVMLCSTVDPQAVRELAVEAEKMNLLLLDAPVSGGRIGAENGSLTIMTSGSAEAYAAAEPALRAISGRIYRLGEEPGLGATYKVVHQLAAGVHLAAAAELMALGAKAGCDPRTLFEIVSESAGQSWMFRDRVPHMLEGDFAPRSMVDIFVKDLGLVLDTGAANKTPLPLSSAAYQMFLTASSMGFGNRDDAAVLKTYEAMAGVSLAEAMKNR